MKGPAMFLKNRELHIKAVKTPKNEDNTPAITLDEVLNPDSVKLIEEHGRKFVKHVAIVIATVAIAIKVVDTLGEIAVKKS